MHGPMTAPSAVPAEAAPAEAAHVAAQGSLATQLWNRWGWLARWGGTALGVWYVARLIKLEPLKAAFASMSAGALLGGVMLVVTGVALGALRWRTMLSAYGAHSRPPIGRAIRLCVEALFYNTYLPGAVAGDVVRAVVTRDSFGPQGTTAAIAVVLAERLLGLFALFVLVLVGLNLGGAAIHIDGLGLYSALGCAASIAGLIAFPLGRRSRR